MVEKAILCLLVIASIGSMFIFAYMQGMKDGIRRVIELQSVIDEQIEKERNSIDYKV